VIYLTEADILLMHSFVIDETSGSHGLRDRQGLLSAIDLPKQKFSNKELYPTIHHKAAVYARNIITAHPFIDGNKRTGITVAFIFLENSKYKIIVPEGEIEKFALKIISERLSIGKIADWFKKYSKKS